MKRGAMMQLTSRILVLSFLVLPFFSGCTGSNESSKEKLEGPKPFELEVLATTMTQIVVQWQNEPKGTSSFELERSTHPSFAENLRSYSLAKGTSLFSDTDREPVSRTRFIGDKRGPLLDPKSDYYYRVKADIGGGSSKYPNTVSARVSGPVRGKDGNLFLRGKASRCIRHRKEIDNVETTKRLCVAIFPFYCSGRVVVWSDVHENGAGTTN